MDEVTVVPQHHPEAELHGPRVTIVYNGLEKQIEFRMQELVGAILQRAIQAFGITQAPHLLSLFTEGGAELPENQTAHDAGIRPQQRLLLRPSAVKGGARR